MTDLVRGQVVLVAGSRWENTPGTDHRLALALAAHHDVLWVDPPVPCTGSFLGQREWPMSYQVDSISEGIRRLRVVVPPGPFRPGLRRMASLLQQRAIRRVLSAANSRPVFTLLCSPTTRFPKNDAGVLIYHVTDDWIAGAELMGLSRRHVRRVMAYNLRRAHIVATVTPYLATKLQDFAPSVNVEVLPNGCEIITSGQAAQGGGNDRRPAVALVGQLNERLDFELLDRITDAGLPLDIIGPRREHDHLTSLLLDKLLGRANVTWFGEVPSESVTKLLERATVGITPYKSDDDFNRASFPLKTLEYLSVGLPVVATDSPAVSWLDTQWIKVGRTHQQFVEFVVTAAYKQLGEDERSLIRAFARQHSWNARVKRLLQLADAAASFSKPSNQLASPPGVWPHVK